MSAHARLAPSSAPIWGNCSGSVAASAGRTERFNERTIQGTAAHWVAEECLRQWRDVTDGSELFCCNWVGKSDPAGTLVTPEIAEGAQALLSDVLKVANRYGGYSQLLIEQRVSMPRIHRTDNWGTLDVALYNPTLKVLFIWDLKFGHSLVRAKNNLQLADYAEGLYEAYAIPLDTAVHFRIVQPFAYSAWGAVDEFVYERMGYLIPLWDQMTTKAAESDTGGVLTAGKHCRYCPAREDCGAAREFGYLWSSICEMPYNMDRMMPDDKARELDLLRGALSTIKARADAIEDSLLADLGSGKPCELKGVEAVAGRLNWHSGMEGAAIAAMRSLGIDIEKHEPRTPTQVMNEAPKELKDTVRAMVGSMASRKSTSKLIDRADSIAARAFSNPDL